MKEVEGLVLPYQHSKELFDSSIKIDTVFVWVSYKNIPTYKNITTGYNTFLMLKKTALKEYEGFMMYPAPTVQELIEWLPDAIDSRAIDYECLTIGGYDSSKEAVLYTSLDENRLICGEEYDGNDLKQNLKDMCLWVRKEGYK